MKRLIEIFAEQKLFGDLLTISIIGLGLYAAFVIRREVFPNVTFDIISVTTLLPGASPEEVEMLVTNPLEQDLKDVDGIKKMTSTSVQGRSLILMQLDVGTTDVEKAKDDIRDVVEGVIPDLPKDTERPIIRSLETKQAPLIEVSVSGEVPPLELRRTAKQLEKEFESIPGVASVKPVGMEDREFQVEVDPARLARVRVSLEEVVSALKGRNVSIPGGTIEGAQTSGFKELLVKTSGQFFTAKDIAETIVRSNELGRSIRISDVAKVIEGLERPTTLTHTDGIPCIRLTLLKKEKEDAIDLVDSVRAKLKEIQPTLDSKIKLTLVNDVSEFVRRRLNILIGNFTIGFGMVLLLLPMFLPWRFALVIGMGEPFALLGTVLAFQAADIGLNIISITGLILVSGILVDDGIVVVENVARLIKKGMPPKEAAIKGSQQIWVPIIASAATTVVAFIPLASMSGIFGKFVKYIPLGVIVPVGISLFENFFVLPHHMSSWLRPKDFELDQRKGIFGFIRYYTDMFWENTVMKAYVGAIRAFVRFRYLIFFGVLILSALSVVFAMKVMKIVLFPPEQVEIFVIRMEAPLGNSLAGTASVLRPIEEKVRALPPEELKNFITSVGIIQQDPHDPLTRRGTELAQIVVYLTPENERTRTAAQIIESLRQELGTPKNLKEIHFERIRTGPPMGKPVSVGVRAQEYDQILPAVKALKEKLSWIPGVSDISDTYYLGKEQVDVHVNYEEAAAAGLDVGTIGTTVRAAYEGLVATSVRTLDEEVKVRVYLDQEQRAKADALSSLNVPNRNGALVPLNVISKLTTSQNLSVRSHENNSREVRVSAEVDTQVISPQKANQKLREELGDFTGKFPGVTYHFGGEDEDTQESLASLARAFVLSLIGIFLILVLTFRTLTQPLVILLTIPLGIISVVFTFFLHGMPISFLGMVGMVGLSGIIANNSIVFVDFLNQARAEGMGRVESLIEAARQRARPIFLTTITTVIGIMPTAYGIGGMDKFVVPIAMSMAWGLLIGSVLILVLLPVALSILDDISDVWLRIRGKAKRPVAAVDRR